MRFSTVAAIALPSVLAQNSFISTEATSATTMGSKSNNNVGERKMKKKKNKSKKQQHSNNNDHNHNAKKKTRKLSKAEDLEKEPNTICPCFTKSDAKVSEPKTCNYFTDSGTAFVELQDGTMFNLGVKMDVSYSCSYKNGQTYDNNISLAEYNGCWNHLNSVCGNYDSWYW